MYAGTTSNAGNDLTRREQQTADKAFKRAIAQGRLSDNPSDANFTGHYMYMGRTDGHDIGRDLFKNINTRQYDV